MKSRALLLLAFASLALTGCGAETGTPAESADVGFNLSEDAAWSRLDAGRPDADASMAGGDDAGSHTDLAMPDAGLDSHVDTSRPDAEIPTEPDSPADACADQDQLPADPNSRPAINDNPRFIQVYNNNIENLKTAGEECRGDWTDLIHYMKTIEPSPDVFLVQQISNTAQLQELVGRMSDALPGVFEGVIAEGDPKTQRSPCGPEKAQQTNAIIYRKGRFSRVGQKHVWQSWAEKDGGCVRNHQARTKNLMLKLHDKIANKDVTVASLHWSTAQGTGPDRACALKNVREADAKVHMAGYRGDLVIMGGDLNEPDRTSSGSFRAWHREVNGDRGGPLNFRDVIYFECKRKGNLQACLDDNFTIGSGRRIDFVFGQDGNGCRARVRRQHTISFAEADAAAKAATGGDSSLNYSDHRAIRAEIYY